MADKNKVDEQAFIDAIQKDPEDEALRSVYADWLEECGDVRGEYLRLEAQYHRIRPRIETLKQTLDKEWLSAVSRTYALVFIQSSQKIMSIREVREITGLGLKEAKDLVEMPSPVLIKDGFDVVEAERMKKRFDGIAEVTIMPSAHAGSVNRLTLHSYLVR
jgi:uncharacterized protein (TIGR02996 family)